MKLNKILQFFFFLLTSTFPAAPLASKCRYNWLSTSFRRFCVRLFGCNSIPWKFTGNPYRSTDSTNNRNALTWIQAVNASLKLICNQRTKGPWNQTKLNETLKYLYFFNYKSCSGEFGIDICAYFKNSLQ